MKKSIYIGGLVCILLLGVNACDTDRLMDMDIPKYMVTDENADLGMLFSNIQVEYTRRSALHALRIPAGYAKYYATHSTIMPGDRYQYSQGYGEDPWGAYTSEGKMVVHLLATLQKKEDPSLVNNLAILQILKGAIFSRLTDIYGNIPYTEAEEAYLENLLYPAYDTQESIYKDILSTLEQACLSFDEKQPVWGEYDIIYKGKLEKWKKFGYSLMLRMAMRMAAVEPETARAYAEKAIAGGVILENEDNFQIACIDNRDSERNPAAQGMVYSDPEKYWKLGADFVEALKEGDPRAKVIFGGKLKSDKPVPNSGIMNTYWFDDEAWIYTVEEQQGYPHGQDVQVTSYERIQKDYTRPSRYLFDYASPVVRLAAHEMNFCIAKAASLGWNTGGRSAKGMYETGVRNNMAFYDQYPGTPNISPAEVDAYLVDHPYSPENLAREMWIANYLDPFEGWFYIRQWGPDLPPNVEGTSMPRRYAYVSSELTRNTKNYMEALTQMGMPADVTNEAQFTYRCWWDIR